MSELGDVLEVLVELYGEDIQKESRIFCAADLGFVCEVLGVSNASKYDGVMAIVPLKEPLEGAKYHSINGEEKLSNYSLLESGIAVPEWIAKESGLPYEKYKPKKAMTQCIPE